MIELSLLLLLQLLLLRRWVTMIRTAGLSPWGLTLFGMGQGVGIPEVALRYDKVSFEGRCHLDANPPGLVIDLISTLSDGFAVVAYLVKLGS